MSEITVVKEHHASPKKARLAAERVAEELKTRYGLDSTWQENNVLAFRRTGLSGQLTLARKQVTLHIKLGLLLSPLRALLEREINDYFDQHFSL
jgi:putative polyhydroxyalkanoate system protein